MSWVLAKKIPLRRPQIGVKKRMPTGIGPHLVKPDSTESEHLGFSDFDKVFKNYDDSSCKVGMPFVGLFGSNGVQCPYCMKINEARDMGQYCQFCRRELAVDVPQEKDHNYNQSKETTGGQSAQDGPAPYEMKFDHTAYPGRIPGDLF